MPQIETGIIDRIIKMIVIIPNIILLDLSIINHLYILILQFSFINYVKIMNPS